MPQFYYRVEWENGEVVDYNLASPAFLDRDSDDARWYRETPEGIVTPIGVWLLVWVDSEINNHLMKKGV